MKAIVDQRLMTNSLAEHKNRFPDCLRMELEIVPVKVEGLLNKIPFIQRESKQLDLILNIRFGEQSKKIHDDGSVTFGLKRGELKIELTKLYSVGGELFYLNL